jgi:threonine dehydrogenase-like Zn-dependent dehydrogenase
VINVKPMIETVAKLHDGAAWFARLSAKDGGKYMKVILEP